MKRLMMIGLGLLALILAGCDDSKTIYITKPDTEPPAAPRGVHSITGDGEVTIQWYPNAERDLDGYRVWKSVDSLAGPYQAITGIISGTSHIDRNVVNGNTYFYAVTACDFTGNESDLSKEDVFDTPRPEGFNVLLRDVNGFPNSSGFDLSRELVVRYNDVSSDFFMEFDVGNNSWFINVGNLNTDIQDMGYTTSMDDVDFSPSQGWSTVGWLEAIEGHTYVIWTADNHYAKIRITALGDPATSGAIFDWAYQIDSGNRELKPAVKPQHDPATYLRRSNGS